MIEVLLMTDWLFNTFGIYFIRPWAWLLLIPVVLLFIWQTSKKNYQSSWSNLIDDHLLQWILPNTDDKQKKPLRNFLLLAFWLLVVTALSGPSWNKLPQPIYSSNDANVLVLDLSSSMDAQDIAPSRLARAKFKLYDLLQQVAEGNSALIVYAGDAFILSPLTSDEKTIENLIRPLETELMPIKGSQPQRGIEKAIELLENANQVTGNIIWVTDGAETSQLETISNLISNTNFQLKILAAGTDEGAPIKMPGGRFLKDSSGNIVVPKLNYSQLAEFANSNTAILTAITADNTDISILSANNLSPLDNNYQKEDIFADNWHDSGYWLILLMLPIVIYSFKNKNVLAVLLLSVALYSPYQSTQASVTDKLFLNKDQQALKQYKQGEFSEAESKFKDQHWKAIAAYKNGDYAAASNYLSQAQSADELYNLGNALALAGDYQTAIDSYQKAIDLDNEHQDAIFNKKVIEDLLQQQEQENPSEQEQEQEQQQEQNEQEQQEQQDQQNQQQQDSQQQNEEQEEQQEKSPEQQLKELSEQEKQQELEQWLKKISDDPGRLIRNKMKLEYNRRGYRSQPSKTW